MLFETMGNKQNPAVLFFHAMGVTGASSKPVAKHLQDRYFCILPTSTVYCANQTYVSKADEVQQIEEYLQKQEVRQLALVVASHPGAIVVNVACGLDTRCYRISGYSHWYNLDLPETMALREKLLPEHDTISQIAMSATEDWGSEIAEKNVPVLVIIEGLLMYLTEADVKQIFAIIAGSFHRVSALVEIMNPMVVKSFKEKSIEGSHAKFTWGIKNGKLLSKLLPGFSYVEEHSLTEGMKVFVPIYKLLDKLPFVRNISNKIVVLEKEES